MEPFARHMSTLEGTTMIMQLNRTFKLALLGTCIIAGSPQQTQAGIAEGFEVISVELPGAVATLPQETYSYLASAAEWVMKNTGDLAQKGFSLTGRATRNVINYVDPQGLACMQFGLTMTSYLLFIKYLGWMDEERKKKPAAVVAPAVAPVAPPGGPATYMEDKLGHLYEYKAEKVNKDPKPAPSIITKAANELNKIWDDRVGPIYHESKRIVAFAGIAWSWNKFFEQATQNTKNFALVIVCVAALTDGIRRLYGN